MSTPKLVDLATGQEIPVTREVTFGREGADVLLSDDQASRHHAAVAPVRGGIAVRDLGSRNGTFVNDQQVTAETLLSDRDTIQIAASAWRVSLPSAAPAADPRPGGGRGDVPAPEAPAASRVHRQPVLAPAATPAFSDASKDGRRVGSAARQIEAAVVSYAVVAATAVAVVAYLLTR